MNERIQEFAEQAGLYVDLPSGTPWPRAMSAEECEAAYKKFARLTWLVATAYRSEGLHTGRPVQQILEFVRS